ncbi:MAG: FprA family A-type flavoprotein [Muribaculaceae bacterium]|jgi:flavorubredoxin|nr:FprA family A-type flavoprotein [Muribaculaceae bacterium]MBQ5724282.1 FprA family A-type flavoprotein [Muribaculaceae bacterium]
MNIKEISGGIYYVGVNDRTTQRFEGLWPLPYGVSYNSYIIKSDKNVLVDTVEQSEAGLFIENIEKVLGGKDLDYLVINHMEPDHSGSIVDIVNRYPNVKIVGNALTINMIKGFYRLENPNHYLAVKDGDTINIGDKTLKFIMTPMVHWPETMMTYVCEPAIMFTGDAFGTFGALNGAVIDHEMNTDVYFHEMYRYYSNIVGKYGVHVQKALAKVAGIDIKMICPTHGPVWVEEIARVVELTDKLSKGEAEDGVVIVYGTMYGNTARYAEIAAQRFAENGIKNIKVYNATFAEISDILADIFRYKGLVIGGPTYSANLFPPIEALLKALEVRELKNKALGVFGSYTWASSATKLFHDYSLRLGLPLVSNVEIRQRGSEQNEEDIRMMADNIVHAIKLL